MHAMIYTSDAEGLRDFFRDVLEFPHVDVGQGWLIFDMAEADLGCHPGEKVSHDVSFYTDDLEASMAQLAAKGVECAPVEDHGWGLVTTFVAPGEVKLMLYQPRYSK